jgi:hypothetical protein
VPIEELFKLAESDPADTGNYRSRVLSVQQTGDAAVGVVAEENYWGTVSFIDYFLLARIEGIVEDRVQAVCPYWWRAARGI